MSGFRGVMSMADPVRLPRMAEPEGGIWRPIIQRVQRSVLGEADRQEVGMGGESRFGLALGGGGARGGAHIGLLKVLDEEGIRVGPIAGTSAGGVVGGLYAAGLSGVEIESVRTSFDPAGIIDPDFSGWGLLSAQRFIDLVRRRVDNACIEDLPHRFAAVAVDLQSSQEVLLDSGPLATAMQATIAVPGILCPLEREGCLLVDGGLLNNVPVDACRKLGAERVLAVDVGVPPDLPLEVSSFSMPPGPMPRLLQRVIVLTGRKRAALAISKSIALLTAQLTAYRLKENPPDLLLRPDLEGIPVMEIERLAEAIAAGERMAREHMEQIRRLASA
jgi:NTE family protein